MALLQKRRTLIYFILDLDNIQTILRFTLQRSENRFPSRQRVNAAREPLRDDQIQCCVRTTDLYFQMSSDHSATSMKAELCWARFPTLKCAIKAKNAKEEMIENKMLQTSNESIKHHKSAHSQPSRPSHTCFHLGSSCLKLKYSECSRTCRGNLSQSGKRGWGSKSDTASELQRKYSGKSYSTIPM